jgi:NADPH:quinone reductase-like Zn-dependent oxidoreductase
MSGSKLPEGVDIGAFIRKRLRFEGSSLRSRTPEYQGKLRDRLEGYLENFKTGSFKIFVDKIFPWENVVDAHKEMEKNTSMGKLICKI